MTQALKAGIAYFATVFAIGFALGVARVLVLAPQLGELRSVLVELPFILSASWIICGYLIGRYSVSDDWRFRALMGGTALVLLMLAELALSVLIFGRSIEAHLEAYQSLGAVVGLAGQIGFALLPMLRKMRSR